MGQRLQMSMFKKEGTADGVDRFPFSTTLALQDCDIGRDSTVSFKFEDETAFESSRNAFSRMGDTMHSAYRVCRRLTQYQLNFEKYVPLAVSDFSQ